MEPHPRIQGAIEKIETIISRSLVPEDPIHSLNTAEWVIRLKPEADEVLLLAARGHDIERGLRDRRVKRNDFSDYDTYKQAHADQSARLIGEILEECGLPEDFIARARHLVARHEFGGDPESDLLKDADSLSYFEVNLPFFLKRRGFEETLIRARWGYGRLSLRARGFLAGLKHEDQAAARVLEEVLD